MSIYRTFAVVYLVLAAFAIAVGADAAFVMGCLIMSKLSWADEDRS